MNGFEINKVIAAILATVLIVFSINKFTDILFRTDKPQQSAYKVEKVETKDQKVKERYWEEEEEDDDEVEEGEGLKQSNVNMGTYRVWINAILVCKFNVYTVYTNNTK